LAGRTAGAAAGSDGGVELVVDGGERTQLALMPCKRRPKAGIMRRVKAASTTPPSSVCGRVYAALLADGGVVLVVDGGVYVAVSRQLLYVPAPTS
jgi:hypothetical protein